MKTSFAICVLLFGMMAIASSQQQYDMTQATDMSKILPWRCKTADRAAQDCPKFTVQGCLCVKGNTCTDSLTNKCNDCQNADVLVSAEGVNCRALLGLPSEVPEGEQVEPEAETPVKNATEPIINVTNITNITNDTTASNTTNTSVVVNVTNDTPVINITNKTTIPEAVEEEAEKTRPNATEEVVEKPEEAAEKSEEKSEKTEEESEKTPAKPEKTEEETAEKAKESTEKTEEESEKTPAKPEKAEESTEKNTNKAEESTEKAEKADINNSPKDAAGDTEEGQDIIVIDDDENQYAPATDSQTKKDCGCNDNNGQVDYNQGTIIINGGGELEPASYDIPSTNMIYERYSKPSYRKSHFRYIDYQLAPINFYIPQTAYVCQQQDRGLKMFNLQFNNLFTPSCVFYKDGSVQTVKTNACNACNRNHVAAITEGQGCHQFNSDNLFQLYIGY